jgi:phospho-N-acetylmuramoyl-pentapeptide-transferase
MHAGLFAPFLIGVLGALLAGLPLIPLLRSLKAQQFISSDAPQRHQAKGGTPTMGGAIILAGALLGTFLAPLVTPVPRGELDTLRGVLLCTVAFGAIGFLDDFLIIRRGKNLGLRAREKLAGQFLVAALFELWRYQSIAPWLYAASAPWCPPVLLAVIHVLMLVGMSNAVNLTDGLDGLAAGVSLPVWIYLALAGAAGGATFPIGSLGLVLFCAAFAGGTLGYLWYNAHPAQVFMGDTGSLAIGGGMAAAAIALRQEWLLLVAAGVHLIEAASVTLQVISFKTTGRRIFKMSPIHHHFELCDWPETRIVARFAILSAIFSALALAILTHH